MAYQAINPDTIKVGDPITKELLDIIKENFANHEARIGASEVTGGSVHILNAAFSLANFRSDKPFIFFYKALQDFELVDFRIQLFDKQGLTSGTLSFDLQKSVDTNDANFNTILSSAVSFDFSSSPDHETKSGPIATGSVVAGELLRIEVTAIPETFSGRVMIAIAGA